MSWHIFGDKERTSQPLNGAIIEIDDNHIRYYLLEFNAIWGYTLKKDMGIIKNWLEKVNLICDSSLSAENFEFFFAVGMFADLTLNAFLETLVQIIRDATTLDAPLDLAVICYNGTSSITKDTKHKFIDAIGVGIAHEWRELPAFPTATQLQETFKALKPNLPSTLEVAVINRDDTTLSLENLVILDKTNFDATRGFIGSVHTLYLSPKTERVWIHLKSSGIWITETYHRVFEVKPKSSHLTIQAQLTYGNLKPDVTIEGGDVHEKADGIDLSKYKPPHLHRKVVTHQAVFLLDGSISSSIEFSTFFTHLIRPLYEHPSSLKLGYVVYGQSKAYREHLRFQEPQHISDIERFSHNIPPVDTYNHTFYLPLESALHHLLSKYRFDAIPTHIVLIGWSPPYPTQAQINKFPIYGPSANAINGLDWHEKLLQLKQRKNYQMVSVLVPPIRSLNQGQKQYQTHVWKTFHDKPIIISGFNKDTGEQVGKQLLATFPIESDKYELSEALILPLLHPLADII